MTTEHKCAHILRALADGKEVQYKNIYDQWIDYKGTVSAVFNDPNRWRIKPEKKKLYLIIVKTPVTTHRFMDVSEASVEKWHQYMVQQYNAVVLHRQTIEFEDN